MDRKKITHQPPSSYLCCLFDIKIEMNVNIRNKWQREINEILFFKWKERKM